MITTDQFKHNATRFRRRAKKLEFDFALSHLLDMYAWAHYNAPYHVVHARGWIEEPAFPPPYLENSAWRFEIDSARILEALEEMPRHEPLVSTNEPPLTAELFQRRAKLFRQIAPERGIRLKMTATNDLYALMHFDRRYSAVMAALSAGKVMGMGEPEYLNAACALFGVEPRRAYSALCAMFDYGNGL